MRISRLDPSDLDDCLVLATSRGWAPEQRKWALLFDAGEVYGMRDPGGGLAGCVALTRYGEGLAIVGMMLVAERCGRRGLGGRLMEHALEAAGAATVFLYATVFGQPLYERLGFRALGTVTTSIGEFTGARAGATRAATPADRAAIDALDAGAIGADRTRLLDGYLALAEQVRVLERDGAVRGFAAGALNGGTLVVGPAVAPDAEAARALIADVAARAAGTVRLDLEQRDDGLLAWAARHGVAPQDTTALMVHGERELPGDRARLVLPAMLALG